MIEVKELLGDEDIKNRFDKWRVENKDIFDDLFEVNEDFYNLVKIGLMDLVRDRIVTDFKITQGYIGLNKNGLGYVKSIDKKCHLKIFNGLLELKNACYEVVYKDISTSIPSKISRKRFLTVTESLRNYSVFDTMDVLLGRHIANYEIFEKLESICNPNVSDYLKKTTSCESDSLYDIVYCYNKELDEKLINNRNIKKNLREKIMDYLTAIKI